jgi:hypothetical protein
LNVKPLDIVEFLQLLIAAFRAAGIEYLIGGSIASWAWGEPRATQDIDFVVDIPIEAVKRLSQELEAREMLVSADIILETLVDNRADLPINAIHLTSGLKADIYLVRPGDELRQSAFRRRMEVDFGPPIGRVFVHSPEDLILYKLIYFSLSQQSKHVRDIASILRSQEGRLDFEYIGPWVGRLGLSALWAEIAG